ANAGDFIYIFYGTLNNEGKQALAPKGKFFMEYRDAWMPEVPGLFQKREIKRRNTPLALPASAVNGRLSDVVNQGK
ncbi:MAG: hypothetical protein M1823_008454, partial [Watsoniomyces obsoletus]